LTTDVLITDHLQDEITPDEQITFEYTCRAFGCGRRLVEVRCRWSSAGQWIDGVVSRQRAVTRPHASGLNAGVVSFAASATNR